MSTNRQNPETFSPGPMTPSCNLSTWEAEGAGFDVQGEPLLFDKFVVSLGYVRPNPKIKEGRTNKTAMGGLSKSWLS